MVTGDREMSLAAHAALARARARQFGYADGIHYVDDGIPRADALYGTAKRLYEDHGIRYWEGGHGPFLMHDGRIVIGCDVLCIAEEAQNG
jgi:hypothetical protein